MPYPGRPHRAWRQEWHGPWGDEWMAHQERAPRMSPRARLLIPVVVSLLVQLPAALYWLVNFGNANTAGIATVALAVAGPLALLGARRWPGPVVLAVSIMAGADFILADPTPGPPYMALAFAIVGALIRNARMWAWVSIGATWTLTLALGVALSLNWHPARVAISTLGILIVFGIGEGMRSRREHFEDYRRVSMQRKQTEVQAERVRIARELHDVLAHSLSQINVQASVGLHLMDKQPEKAADALASIKESSKTALDEVRSVLGVLRAEDGQDPSAPLVPEPDLSRLVGLAASVTSQGVEVTLTNSVDAAPKAVQLAIYRIVQESLTNVVRHAGATSAHVDIRRAKGSFVVSIADNGAGLGDDTDGGRGMLGMRERAELLGGTLEVGASPQGGVLVTARIPDKEHDE